VDRRARGARLARAAALTLAAFAALVPAAQAGWGRPFQFTQPGTLDLLAPQLAFSPAGAAAAGFGIEDVDTPGSSQAYVSTRSARGSVGSPRRIGSAGQILALSFDGPALELLTGTSPTGLSCCSAAQAVRLTAAGALERPRTLVSGLTGATDGQLLTLGQGMLATVATERGVWAVQAAQSNRFGTAHRLSGAGETPGSLSAAWLGGQNSVLAWTAAQGLAGALDLRSIYYSDGSKSGGPRHAHTLLTVASGHAIDELAIAARGSGATAVWVESWYDRRGSFHSGVRAADFGPQPVIRSLSPADQTASGLSLAADPAGNQVVSWKACDQTGSCTVQAAVRGSAGRFGGGARLGVVDPGQTPSAAVGAHGRAIVGWIRYGHPVASAGAVAGHGFGSVQVLSSTTYAFDLSVGFVSGRDALAAWTQGTLNPSLVGAAYRAP
jgi:hypothetical protein